MIPRLEIETGRWVKTDCRNSSIPRTDRICTLCYENNIKLPGDEEHAIMNCTSFSDDRYKLLGYLNEKYPSFSTLDNSGKVVFMLTCEEEPAYKVSKFLLKIISSQRPNFEQTWKKMKSHNYSDYY